jgi:RNA polymerase sigma-70 factor (ECF subfamily)
MTASGQVARMLALLPSTQREVLRLRLVVQLSVEESAAVLGATTESVTVAQKRALLVLREEFIASRRRQPDD